MEQETKMGAKICEGCSTEFKTYKKHQRFCNRSCANKSLNLIKDPIEQFFREKITRLRSNAKKRNKEFNLTWQDLRNKYNDQKGKCFYTSRTLQLTYSTKERKVCPPDQLSVDRLDSNKGYVIDNIVLCCYAINNFKGDSMVREFLDYINFLVKRPLNVKIKKLDNRAIIPSYAKKGDGGLDLTAITSNAVEKDGTIYIEYKTGLAFEIPEGYVGLIFPRSSISKKDLVLSNSVGVIDSGYRGEVSFRFKSTQSVGKVLGGNQYRVGDRVGQMIIMPYPSIELEEVEELSQTVRGEGGFGSSGA